MPYLQLGSVSSFNSTAYPGVCKPSDLATLAIFKNLQAQLNRILYAYNKALGNSAPLISVDGDIGPNTVQLLFTVQGFLTNDSSQQLNPSALAIIAQDSSSCSAVASNADTIAGYAQTTADSLGAPSKISQPSSGSSTLVSSSGKSTTVHTPTPANSGIATSLTDMVSGLDTTTLLLIAAGAGALIYFTGRPSKKLRTKAKGRRRSSITIYR